MSDNSQLQVCKVCKVNENFVNYVGEVVGKPSDSHSCPDCIGINSSRNPEKTLIAIDSRVRGNDKRTITLPAKFNPHPWVVFFGDFLPPASPGVTKIKPAPQVFLLLRICLVGSKNIRQLPVKFVFKNIVFYKLSILYLGIVKGIYIF